MSNLPTTRKLQSASTHQSSIQVIEKKNSKPKSFTGKYGKCPFGFGRYLWEVENGIKVR